MIRVKQKENETRKNYLVRVAIKILDENAYQIDTMELDEAECDAICLAEDLRNEFDIEED
tara:strand:- start:416 stop:595 length:180 start_codon:yes stop_codon:yes gene_type:complete